VNERADKSRTRTRTLLAPALCCVLALTASCVVPATPPTRAPEPAAPSAAQSQPRLVTELEGITEYRLENGLKVLLLPDPSAATLMVNVTYRVGSRHEGRGEGGMAHLLEHMVFKGTPTFPSIFGALQDRGAQFNGTTSYDRTNYFETLPASDENLDFALRMEADRMINSKISAEDLKTEMTVVRNEFESGENNPDRVLVQRMIATAYLFHGYGRPVIGNQSDIERVPADALKLFYRKYYQPDNAMLVLAGRFDRDAALRKIQQYFGAIPRPERKLDETYTLEPPQDGPRQVVLSRVGSSASAGAVYHIPAATHPDMPALDVLSGVLSDPPNGRLYKALVTTQKAASVSAGPYGLRESGVMVVTASVPLKGDPKEVQAALTKQLETLAGSIRADEVERSKNSLLKDLRLSLNDYRRTTLALSEAEAIGDWKLLFADRERIAGVTVEDVNRVAKQYLLESNRTAGLFVPDTTPQRAEIPSAPDLASLLERYKGSTSVTQGEVFEATAENIERSVQRRTVDGIALVLLPKKTRGEAVQGRLRIAYGAEKSLAGYATAAQVLPRLMLRGTKVRDYQALRDTLDAIETDLNLSGGPGYIDVELRTTRANLPKAINLLGEILRTPSLPQAELDVIRKELVTQYEAQLTDPQGRLFNEIYRAVSSLPKTHPLYRPTLPEQIERTRNLNRKEIVDLHARFVGAGNTQASFVGDFDVAQLEAELGKAIGSWKSREAYARIETPYVPTASGEQIIETPDKKNAVIGRGIAFKMRSDDPDFPAVSFANFVLGMSSKSRLMNKLRQETGLSYGTGSYIQVSDEDDAAYQVAFAILAPQNALRGRDLMRAEFERWLTQPMSDAELAEFRTGYAESFRTQLGDDRFVAGALLTDLRIGRAFTVRQQRIDAAVKESAERIQSVLKERLSVPSAEMIAGDRSKFDAAAPDSKPSAQ